VAQGTKFLPNLVTLPRRRATINYQAEFSSTFSAELIFFRFQIGVGLNFSMSPKSWSCACWKTFLF